MVWVTMMSMLSSSGKMITKISIHHEYDDKFEVNELEDFKELYADKLKKIEVIEPYKFDLEFSDRVLKEICSCPKSRRRTLDIE